MIDMTADYFRVETVKLLRDADASSDVVISVESA